MSDCVLSKGEIAIITKSPKCSCLNITFPHVNLHLDPSSFASFHSLIEQVYQHSLNFLDMERSFLVDTPYQGILFHFNKRELGELCNLMARAELRLQAQEVIHQIQYSEN